VTDDATLTQATELVDKALAEMSGRSLVSAQEIADLLLDIRIFLTAEAAGRADG
jgi:hypothetical protein